MTSIEEYFTDVRRLIQDIPESRSERYEEQILSPNRGILRIRLRFQDRSLLEISEALIIVAEEPHWMAYRYHYQDPSGALVFRYDNTPHHPEVSTHPDHKHSGERVVESSHPSMEQLLIEVTAVRKAASSTGQ